MRTGTHFARKRYGSRFLAGHACLGQYCECRRRWQAAACYRRISAIWNNSAERQENRLITRLRGPLPSRLVFALGFSGSLRLGRLRRGLSAAAGLAAGFFSAEAAGLAAASGLALACLTAAGFAGFCAGLRPWALRRRASSLPSAISCRALAASASRLPPQRPRSAQCRSVRAGIDRDRL